MDGRRNARWNYCLPTDVRIPHKQTVQQHRSPGGRDKIYWHAFERKPDGGIRPGRLRAPVPESGAVRLDILGVFAAQTLIVNVGVHPVFGIIEKKNTVPVSLLESRYRI